MNGTSRPAFAVADLTGWKEHDGTRWPDCKPEDPVHIQRRNGAFRFDKAWALCWAHKGDQFDITHYRAVSA